MQQEQQQAPRKLRVLCLHSWRTSGAIFKQQFRRSNLDVALADLMEFVFITAPMPASGPIPADVAGTFEGPYYEWFTTEKAQDGQELVFTYHNILESEAFIMAKIRELGPFDGICGFSQGGAMASIMVALQRAGLALQDVPPFKFALFFGSVLTTHPRYLPAFKERVQVPSCHIIGHKDYVKEHAIALVRNFEAPIVIMHSRGHIVPPLLREHLSVLRAFLIAMRDLPAQQAHVQERQQQQQPATAGDSSKLDPLDPPQPIWETEAEQVKHQINSKQQQQQQEAAAREKELQQLELQRRQQYVQRVKLSGKIPGGYKAKL